jgi:hypothetical protein
LISHTEGRVSAEGVKHLDLDKEYVAGSWRKLHNKELHDLYTLPDIIMVISHSRWESNIRMDLE